MDLYRRCSKVEALEGGYREQSVPFVLTANKTRCNVGFSMTTVATTRTATPPFAPDPSVSHGRRCDPGHRSPPHPGESPLRIGRSSVSTSYKESG